MPKYHLQLRTIINTTSQQLAKVNAIDFEQKPSLEKWSKKEILGHLIDSAYNNHQRFSQAVTKDDLIFNGYDQVQWVINNRYQQRTIAELSQTWASVNQHLSFLLEGLSEDLLNRTNSAHNFHKICMNRLEAGDSPTLSYLVWDYIFHVEHHLAQILPTYEKMDFNFSIED